MKKNIVIVIGIVLVCLVVLGVYAINSEGRPGTNPTIKIGVTLPLTGDEATLGESNRNAIHLAASKLPSSTKYNYQLIFEDDQFNPALGASAVNKLISIDGVSALISFGSPV